MSKKNLKIEQGKATRNRLLTSAKRIFSEQGYSALTLDSLIHELCLTKGAFYHHFPSKLALFEEVYIQAQDVVACKIKSASKQETGPWNQLLAGCDAYLEACSDPGLQRILRIDGPSVLGWERWSEIDAQYRSELETFLEWMRRDGFINIASTKALVHQLSGAMNEATFWIAQAEDQSSALIKSKMVLRQLLDTIRAQ
ncbi:MAG: TetR family transcriptional regulator [Opitutaceae bacterium]|nr:TetR family transcriptional regulator [Opitutaceae bacterium]|tara:strand:- start:1681 stop:2274 length:594 start_codon:yes stop_codon:yes gene_type:complete